MTCALFILNKDRDYLSLVLHIDRTRSYSLSLFYYLCSSRNHVTILVSFAFSHIVTIVWKAAGVKCIMSCSFIRLKRVFQEMFFYLTCEKHVMNQLMIFSFKQETCFIFVSMAATETLTLFCCRSVVHS